MVKGPRRYRDPIVEEVRAVREAIDEEVGHDVAKLAERAGAVGEAYRRRLGVKAAEIPSETAPLGKEG
ncbi:MAG: hypothetical protein JXQ73_31070 [Phycisphaerae bacterium]|nr:hypothetical protein [Phycisphaerae bacterium]